MQGGSVRCGPAPGTEAGKIREPVRVTLEPMGVSALYLAAETVFGENTSQGWERGDS